MSCGALDDNQKVYTLTELALFLGGSEDSFTGCLLYVIAKGYPGTDSRFARGFPVEVRAYEVWMAAKTQPTAMQLLQRIAVDVRFRDDHLLGIVHADKWEP